MLGVGYSSYSLRDDLVGQKVDVTFGQLLELVPKMKPQWKSLVNPTEKEPKRGSVPLMSLQKLPDICLTVEAWYMEKNMEEAYIDGGAQVRVITHACVEKFGLQIAGNSGFRIRMANHQKVKCLGMVQNLEIEVFEVKISCHNSRSWGFPHHFRPALVASDRCYSRLEEGCDYTLQ